MEQVSFQDLFAVREERMTYLAHRVENELMAALVPVFKKYGDQGVPIRLLCYLASSAAKNIETVALAEQQEPQPEE